MSTASATQSVQVKVTLPAQLQRYAQSKADRFGMTLSSYIKHLVLDDVRDMDLPTYAMSAKTEQVAIKALAAHKKGKTTEINNIDNFLNDL